MKLKQPSQILFIIAGTLTILGAFGQLFNLALAPYLFSLGSGLLIYVQGKNAYDIKTSDARLRRLARLGFLTSLLLAIAAYLMFTGSNSWVVLVLMYAALSFFLSFRGN
jgi:hypothetical protein